MKPSWNPFNAGLRGLRAKYQVNELIEGKRLWFISGSVEDGNFGALYQCSLNVLVGDKGLMFADSFWLPRFLVTQILVPWQNMSTQFLHAESFEFDVDGVEIDLFGKRIADAVRTHSPFLAQ